MKIPPSSDLLKSVQTPASGGSRPNGAASAAVPAASDRVTLSTPIAGGDVSANAEAGFDRAKVEAIKAAIRDGTLSVDSGVVADRMLAQALALLTKGK